MLLTLLRLPYLHSLLSSSLPSELLSLMQFRTSSHSGFSQLRLVSKYLQGQLDDIYWKSGELNLRRTFLRHSLGEPYEMTWLWRSRLRSLHAFVPKDFVFLVFVRRLGSLLTPKPVRLRMPFIRRGFLHAVFLLVFFLLIFLRHQDFQVLGLQALRWAPLWRSKYEGLPLSPLGLGLRAGAPRSKRHCDARKTKPHIGRHCDIRWTIVHVGRRCDVQMAKSHFLLIHVFWMSCHISQPWVSFVCLSCHLCIAKYWPMGLDSDLSAAFKKILTLVRTKSNFGALPAIRLLPCTVLTREYLWNPETSAGKGKAPAFSRGTDTRVLRCAPSPSRRSVTNKTSRMPSHAACKCYVECNILVYCSGSDVLVKIATNWHLIEDMWNLHLN